MRRILRYFRARRAVTIAVGAVLEIVTMALLALVDSLPGTTGALGVALAVLTALAAGPEAGVAVALVGWTTFYFLPAEQDAAALAALAIWPATAYVVGVLANMQFETERRLGAAEQEQAELRRLDRAKSQFVALASHELRTPAAVVAGIAATLHARGDELSDVQLRELRRTLHEQAQRLTQLIEQLLDLSRLEAHAVRIEEQAFFVRPRIEEVLLLSGANGSAGVNIEVDPDLEVVADPTAFDRIVANLVTNALRYGQPPVTVRAAQRDRHFRLTVEDRGPGVASDFVPRLFDRFSRSEESADTHGSGLGLAIAQSYAQAHGGEILYEHLQPKGSRFEFVLPRAER